MRFYVDSSALVKRAVEEPQSAELEATLRKHLNDRNILFASSLATVEVSRIVRSRLDDEAPARVGELIEIALGGIAECVLSSQVVGVARRLGPSTLRSLDAIHLATASIMAADVVIAYEPRLLRAAEELGFRTLSPGG